MNFEEFILYARQNNASDIHLTVGAPTVFRINGELVRFSEMSEQVVNKTILALLTAEQEKRLTEGEDLDFTFQLSNGARQRVNVYRQGGKLAASIRLLNEKIPDIDSLGLPPIISELAKKKRGLILATGPTGSGKTTTLSAVIDYINKNRACHIITIEDPVEYKYEPQIATIHQREIGRDVPNFNYALRSALREDPDVIMVGEMRDYETIMLALTAAETGHLVLATLHTIGAAQTINRIIDACPPNVQEQIRTQLSTILEAVISQTLIPTKDGKNRALALEILIGTDAVKNLIRSNKVHQLASAIQQGSRQGMSTLSDSIANLIRRDKISRQAGLEYCSDKEELLKLINAGF
jgi:twitching motility protein PilT